MSCTIAASCARVGSATRPYEPKPALLHSPATNFSDARTRRDERAPLRRVGEVGGHGQRLDAVRGAQRRGELLEPVGAARDEDELVAERGELAGELRRRCPTRRR